MACFGPHFLKNRDSLYDNECAMVLSTIYFVSLDLDLRCLLMRDLGMVHFLPEKEARQYHWGKRRLAGIKIPRRTSESHASGHKDFGFAKGCQVSACTVRFM